MEALVLEFEREEEEEVSWVKILVEPEEEEFMSQKKG